VYQSNVKNLPISYRLHSIAAAFEVLCENLNLASFEDRAQATDEELTFLAELFQGPIFPGLLKVRLLISRTGFSQAQ